MDGFESLEHVHLEALDETYRSDHGSISFQESVYPAEQREERDNRSSLREGKLFLELVEVDGLRITGKRRDCEG